jgi:hypothetical protein
MLFELYFFKLVINPIIKRFFLLINKWKHSFQLGGFNNLKKTNTILCEYKFDLKNYLR